MTNEQFSALLKQPHQQVNTSTTKTGISLRVDDGRWEAINADQEQILWAELPAVLQRIRKDQSR